MANPDNPGEVEDERRALLLLDMIEDWVKHSSEPRQRMQGFGEDWQEADFLAALSLLEQGIAELGN